MKHTQPLSEFQEEIIQQQVKELAKEIDDGILLDLLVEGGWTKVPFLFQNSKHAVDVHEWCEKNIKLGQWQRLCGAYVFRKKEYAEWFILRWV